MISDQEIQHLFRFVAMKRVRYKDVQIELVDHLATAIEEKMKADNGLSFERALRQVYDGFGIFGFAKVVQEKEKNMTKFWQRRIWRMFKEYYTIPKIIGTAASCVLLFYLLSFQFITLSYLTYAMVGIAFLGIIWQSYKNYVLDNEIRDFLYVKSYYGMAGFIIYFTFYFPHVWVNPGLEEISLEGNNWLIIGYSLYIPAGILLFYICLVELPRQLRQEFNQKYAKYLSP